MEMSMKYH